MPLYLTSSGNEENKDKEANIKADQMVANHDPSKRTERFHEDASHPPKQHLTHVDFCNRSSLFVSFADLGLHQLIIAPDGYDAGVCLGKCPFPLQSDSTNHAIVQSLTRLTDPQVPEPCCVPTNHEPLTDLFHESQLNVVLRKYNEMIAQTCGCRWSWETIIIIINDWFQHTWTMWSNLETHATHTHECTVTLSK